MLPQETRKLILITGPAGSGKTTLAKRIAQQPNWVRISEDDYWVEIKPEGGRRTAEEQDIVMPQVVRDVTNILSAGNNAVLEFIVYEIPPRPLIYYHEQFQRDGLEILVRALRPTEAVIAQRKLMRGREPRSIHEAKHTRRQRACLKSDHVLPEWLIDNSRLSVEETYERYFSPFVDSA